MTIEQKEQHILTLVSDLPVFQRLRLALTILRGVEPEYLTPEIAGERMPWETNEFIAEINRRAEEIRSGAVEAIPADVVFQELRG